MVTKGKKKGQAAMEFLMTYGWAILVVLAAIGALAYFGVLSPKNLLPSSCTVSAGFGCNNAKATPSTMVYTIRNNVGEDVDSASALINFTGDAKTCTAIATTTTPGWTTPGLCNVDTANEDGCALHGTGTTGFRNGKDLAVISMTGCVLSGTASVDFIINVTKSGESVWHISSGKATLKVEQ